MRLGELRNLEWQNVNLALRVIQLVRTKSKKTRAIRMGTGLVELFKRLPKRSRFVFTHENGKPLSEAYYEHEFVRISQRAGIADFSWHGLRDCFANDLYTATKDIRKVQLALGHASVQTTERYLKRLGLLDVQAEVDALSDSIFSDPVVKGVVTGVGPDRAIEKDL